jgi:ANTAR domain
MARFDVESGPRHTDLAEAQKDIDNLHAALTSQPVIEQARGILMANHRCGPDQAFRLLAQASQRENRKLRDLAAAVVASVQAKPDEAACRPLPHSPRTESCVAISLDRTRPG